MLRQGFSLPKRGRTMNTTEQIIPTVERWLPIPGYEGRYEVSDHGRVRSLARTAKACINGVGHRPVRARHLRLIAKSNGYYHVGLCKDDVVAQKTVHSLVAESFIGPRHDGMQVRHVDGDCLNNLASNLMYGTAKDNANDRIRHGRNLRGEGIGNSKVTESIVIKMRTEYLSGTKNITELASECGLSRSATWSAIVGRTWKHIPNKIATGEVENG